MNDSNVDTSKNNCGQATLAVLETVTSLADCAFGQLTSMALMVELALENPRYYHHPHLVGEVMASMRHIIMDTQSAIEGECDGFGLENFFQYEQLQRLKAQYKQRQVVRPSQCERMDNPELEPEV